MTLYLVGAVIFWYVSILLALFLGVDLGREEGVKSGREEEAHLTRRRDHVPLCFCDGPWRTVAPEDRPNPPDACHVYATPGCWHE